VRNLPYHYLTLRPSFRAILQMSILRGEKERDIARRETWRGKRMGGKLGSL
jgi:hypothetical protein